jgi:regulation of enolase protein 1 (concanavalin A-like superfamily)
MRRAILCILFLLLFSMSGSMSLGCSKGSTATKTTTGSGQTSTATSTIAGTGVATPGGLPSIADVKSLPSYRLSIMTKMSEGAGSVSYMKYEWVRDQKAEHAWTEDANGKITEVYIRIGDRYWMYTGMAGMGWVEQPAQTTTPGSSLSSDLVSQIKQTQQDVEHSKARFDKKGTETVNNVRCTRYEFEYDLTTDMPNLATGGTRKVDTHSSGEAWISAQSGLPAVMIKSKSTTAMTMAVEKTVIDSEQNLTDIGAAITINPPEGAVQVPTGIPASPSGTPKPPATTKTTTAPPTTTVTPSATGGTPIFNDSFQTAWNSKWVWTDPNNDATHSLTARNGFLRLTVPEDNDLAGGINYDAPRLLVPQNGNFLLETLVEFDPKEYYQGAGLLVWQDEDAFLRLEFGFGGMGGGDKNVVFVKQEDGGLGLVDGVDLPAALKRIELRLQRNVNQYTAWYREVGGVWQTIGSTELSFNPSVNVGIAQITQYTSSKISADFDYFRVFVP